MRVDVIPGATPKVLRRWFVDGSTGPDGGGIWGPGGIAIGPLNEALFVSTGNALDYPENQFYADHVVRLGLNLYVEAANNPSDLDNQAVDLDFGATPLLYHPPGCPPLLAVPKRMVPSTSIIGTQSATARRRNSKSWVRLEVSKGLPLTIPASIRSTLQVMPMMASVSFSMG